MNALLPLPSLLDPGQTVGGCRILRFVGRGGMGEVYLAEHLALRRPVALKVLDTHESDRQSVDRFLQEARICCRIEHSNVVNIYNVGFDAGLHFIIMQYIDGLNLNDLVRDLGGPLSWQAAIRVTRQAARGLAAVHAHHLVHRDVKPANIMLARDSRVVLMDFGLVRDLRVPQPRQIVGTPAFMSPEQCRGRGVDRRSDIFSLGATLYFLLTATSPFEGTVKAAFERASREKRPADLGAVNPALPRELGQIVARAMDPSPSRRFSCIPDMITAMGRVLEQGRP